MQPMRFRLLSKRTQSGLRGKRPQRRPSRRSTTISRARACARACVRPAAVHPRYPPNHATISTAQLCELGNAWLGPLIAFIFLTTAAVVFVKFQHQLTDWYSRHQDKLEMYGQRGTVMFVTMQIMLILDGTHESVGGSKVPSPFGSFLDIMGFMAFDVVKFVPFECMVSEGQQFDHLDALLVQTLAPLMLLAGGQVFAWVQRRRKIGGKKHYVLSSWLTLMFLVLPVISRSVFESFRCLEFGESHLQLIKINKSIIAHLLGQLDRERSVEWLSSEIYERDIPESATSE
mmetsp:Transcript_88228/g.252121  ORF Transcript_88228/g.252121 Transcript_88228/m.252121 type:complete len:288 (+) Transcript_88228:1356-2219(+)